MIALYESLQEFIRLSDKFGETNNPLIGSSLAKVEKMIMSRSSDFPRQHKSNGQIYLFEIVNEELHFKRLQ